jgi:hypothetical protein
LEQINASTQRKLIEKDIASNKQNRAGKKNGNGNRNENENGKKKKRKKRKKEKRKKIRAK